MGKLRINRSEYKYKKYNRSFKEQFINCINDKAVISEINLRTHSIKDTIEVTSKQVLALVQRLEAQTLQKSMLATIQDTNKLV